MKKKQGSLFVVSAPSGAGKTTLCHKICETVAGIKHSVSYTTRKPRAGEIDGIHYIFVDEDEFRSMISEGEFIEWAEVHGNFYGTSKKQIEQMVCSGIDAILDIDVQGAKQIRENLSAVNNVLIFVLPPSMEALKQRLSGRGTDSVEVIAKRLKNAIGEIKEYKNYDYVIINDIFDEAVKEMSAVIIAERTRLSKIGHNWPHNWIEENFFKED
jgi:guanylate kinase